MFLSRPYGIAPHSHHYICKFFELLGVQYAVFVFIVVIEGVPADLQKEIVIT
jgi:hypothetical protein